MNKKLVGGLIIATLAVGGGYGGYTYYQASQTSSQVVTEIVARESAVELGSITIGLTESGTISIPTETVTFDYNLLINEIHVKEGYAVKEGDLLFSVYAEDLEDEITALEDQIESYLDQIENYEDAIKTYYKQITTYESQITTYTRQIRNYETNIRNYNSQIASYYKQQESIRDSQDDIRDAQLDLLDAQDDLRDYQLDIRDAQDDVRSSQEDIREQQDDLRKQQETIYKNIASLESEYQSLIQQREVAVNNQQMGIAQAQLTYQQALNLANTSENTYAVSMINIETQLIELEKKASDYQKEKASLESLISTYDADYAKLIALEDAMDDAAQAVSDKEYEAYMFSREYGDYLTNNNIDLDSLSANVDSLYAAQNTAHSTMNTTFNLYVNAEWAYQANPTDENYENYQSALTEYATAYTNWETAVSAYNTARDNYRTQVVESGLYDSADENYWILQDEIDDLEDIYDTHRNAYTDFSAEFSSLYGNSDKDDLEEQLEDVIYNIQLNAISLSSYDQTQANDLISAQQTLDSNQLAVTNAETVYNHTLISLQDAVDEVDSKMSTVLDSIYDLYDDIDSLTKDIANLDDDYIDKYDDIADLEDDYNDVFGDIADLVKEYNSMFGDIEDLESDYYDIFADIADVEYYIADTYIDIADTYADIASVEGDILDVYDDIKDTEDDIADLRVDIEELYIEIAELQEVLATSAIYAHKDGIISSISATEGATSNAGSTLLSLVDSYENTYISATVSQDDINQVFVGQDVNIELSALSDVDYKGVIDSIYYTASPSMGGAVNYYITVKITDGDTTGVYEGMSASVTFITEQCIDVPVVSYRALNTDRNRTYVKVQDPVTGEITEVDIETGLSDGSIVEVISGLKEGDIVLIESAVTTMETDSSSSNNSSGPSDSASPEGMDGMSMEDMNSMPMDAPSGSSSGGGPGNRGQ